MVTRVNTHLKESLSFAIMLIPVAISINIGFYFNFIGYINNIILGY